MIKGPLATSVAGGFSFRPEAAGVPTTLHFWSLRMRRRRGTAAVSWYGCGL